MERFVAGVNIRLAYTYVLPSVTHCGKGILASLMRAAWSAGVAKFAATKGQLNGTTPGVVLESASNMDRR